ncbi:MAG: choice-of-anchor B family protein [Lewinellaceae bacterium]|nr:choice-of-anchor B family protein [Lewinellaceae bacterium]
MKKALLLLFFAGSYFFSSAQLNMSLLSHVQYNVDLNDVWGWADPVTGIEYGIVGLRNGVSIVSLEDPSNAAEVQFVPGPNSIWRDIKTWGHFAYVTNETSNGLLVIDLSGLPDNVSYIEWAPTLPNLGPLSSCHNLYIDEYGYCYLAGCNINSGGLLILNVDTDTGEPEFTSAAPPIYAHDVYTINNRMFSSEIYEGQMAIYDVTDKQNIQLLATQPTPYAFTHNIWLNDEQSVAFTTDEIANAPVAAYDISDLGNIAELDEYRPVGTINQGVIPHNVHVWNDYLLISYYTDGGRVVDASRPSNLIEVGNYDTWLGGNGGFDGAWGLYPFLPSQTVLVSDIGNGLYVLQPNFVRACWLEGTVRDSITGALLPNVKVEINSSQPNLGTTDAFGRYQTGQALNGTFDVKYSKAGYYDKTIAVDLENGQLTELDVELAPLASFSVAGLAIQEGNGQPVPGAQVVAQSETLSYSTTADANGNFSFSSVIEGTYNIFAGQWGYLHGKVENVSLSGNTSVTIELERGYQDDFVFDLGWTATSQDATTGFWTRGEPIGTYSNNSQVNPEYDAPNDLGTDCYVTGNGGGDIGTDDVDNGIVTLSSPVMDLSEYIDPVLTYRYWFYNGGGNGQPNDALSIRVTNGTQEAVLNNITQSQSLWRNSGEIHLADFITLTGQVRLIFETSDLPQSGHLVEAGVDQVLVEERGTTGTGDLLAKTSLDAYPNPFGAAATLAYSLDKPSGPAAIQVYDAFGKEIQHFELQDTQGQVNIGAQLPAGVYWARLVVDGQLAQAVRLVKVK